MIHFLSFVWDPPTGINLGFFTIQYYSLMFVIAFALGWWIMKKIYIRENIPLEKLDTIFIYTVFATLIGARLGHVIGRITKTIYWKLYFPFESLLILNLLVFVD
jgi:phosphatidylglycerol:prolipoprotein diacylglycerol transferase